MKTSFKVIGAIFALGTVILVLLHIFLQVGLTNTMRKVVLPRVKQETGIDASVDRLSINVVQGLLNLKGVAIRNPEGFGLENLASVGKVAVEVDIGSLLKQKLIRVKNVMVEDALVNVIRNKDGEININALQERLPKAPAKAPSGEPAPEPEARKPAPSTQAPPEAMEPVPLPEVIIETLACTARVRYIDHKLNDLDLALALELNGTDLSTVRDPAAAWGELNLTGSLGDDRTSFVTDLTLDLAPVTDPVAPSFDLQGRIMEIDPRIMEDIYDSIGIRSAPFGFDPELHCRAGRFENSSFALNLKNIELEDKLSKQLGGMGSIDSLRFPVPVKGTLQEPRVDIQQAIAKGLGGNTKSILGAFLKGTAEKELGVDEPPEKLEEGLKSLGKRLFGN